MCSVCYMCSVHVDDCYHVFLTGLSDEILHSVLQRAYKSLTSLDLSSIPQCLTDFGIDLIGQSLLSSLLSSTRESLL